MRRLLLVCVAVAATAFPAPAFAQVGEGEPVWRVEQRIPGLGTKERFRCNAEGVCWNRHAFRFRTLVSAPSDYIAVRATVRLSYRTTRGDRAVAVMRHLISPPPPLPCCEIPRMSPRSRVLGSRVAWTRKTMTWEAPVIAARDRVWVWSMELDPRDSNRNGRAQVFVRNVSVVLEGWPTEP